MLRWNGKTYRPYGPGVNYKRINPVVKDLMSPLDTNKVGLHLVAQFIIDGDGPGVTPNPTPTPTPTPAPQFFILTESSDTLQAENNDLLVVEAAP